MFLTSKFCNKLLAYKRNNVLTHIKSMVESTKVWLDSPKFLMNDLKQCVKQDDENWTFNIKGQYDNIKVDKTITFNKVYVQGFIDQKPCDNVMILRDVTGKVKLSNCTSAVVPDSNDIVRGAYCSVTGILVREKGLPEISAYKLTKIDNSDIDKDSCYNYWPYEVKDFQLFILGAIKPNE